MARPGVSSSSYVRDPQLRRILTAIDEGLGTLDGRRGTKKQQAVTWGDLVDLKLARMNSREEIYNPLMPVAAGVTAEDMATTDEVTDGAGDIVTDASGGVVLAEA